MLLFKGQAAALCDSAQVCFQILLGHANAVIADGQNPGVLICRHVDLEIRTFDSGVT